MSLTPKNWAAFQHYKNRKPSWIKLHHGLLDDFEFARLPFASKALAPFLWLLASEYEGGEITASHDEIAYRMRIPLKEFRDALTPLIDKGFFVDSDAASSALAECKQSACLEKEREREEEKKVYCAVADATRTPDDSFEKFWAAYPRRHGSNPKHPAAKLFLAAVKQGAERNEIIEGARRFAVDPATKVGTEFVPQAVKWLRDKRWKDYPAQAGNGHAAGYWVALDSPEWDAWARHRGRPFALDRNGGWLAPSQWPPGFVPATEAANDPTARRAK